MWGLLHFVAAEKWQMRSEKGESEKQLVRGSHWKGDDQSQEDENKGKRERITGESKAFLSGGRDVKDNHMRPWVDEKVETARKGTISLNKGLDFSLAKNCVSLETLV